MGAGPRSAPLFQVVGAPGVGKTTLLPELVRLGHGVVAMDKDELFEDGALLGLPITDPEAGPPLWPAYNRMWDRIIRMIRRAGHPVLLLSGTPSPGDATPDRDDDGPIHWVLLDCADQLRLSRLRARGWPSEWIDDAMSDATQSRGQFPTVIRTDDMDTEQIARQILAWTSAAPAMTPLVRAGSAE
ncbi:MAG: AAA family ATPase [Actinopolymorphaceae bacterium]